ncbi:MAG: antitoxin [Deltaproteobacteria bacterium]|nr:MAG: antitoxin [Deltaproteobacteria bacterium]
MSRTNLAMYRMQKAKEILIEARDNLNQKHYGLSVNRSYYAMFTAARALLALKEIDSSKHSGVIALFNQHIVKVELFPKEISRFLPKAKDIREDADYGDFVEITEEDAQTQIRRAMQFVEEAKKTIQIMIPGT